MQLVTAAVRSRRVSMQNRLSLTLFTLSKEVNLEERMNFRAWSHIALSGITVTGFRLHTCKTSRDYLLCVLTPSMVLQTHDARKGTCAEKVFRGEDKERI